MATAYKLLFGSWVSPFRTYIDFGAAEARGGASLLNFNLLCEVGTSIETADYTTIVSGTNPPVDVPIGFDAWQTPDYLARLVAHRRRHPRYYGTLPSLHERGMHVVILDYVDPDDIDEKPYSFNSDQRIRLLRADVTDELTIDDLYALSPERPQDSVAINPAPLFPGYKGDLYGLAA